MNASNSQFANNIFCGIALNNILDENSVHKYTIVIYTKKIILSSFVSREINIIKI